MLQLALAGITLMVATTATAKAGQTCDPTQIQYHGKRVEIAIRISCDVKRDPYLERLLISRAKRGMLLDRQTAAGIRMLAPSVVNVAIETTFVHPRIISLLETRSEYFGGPHGMIHFRSTIWDVERRRPIGLSDFLLKAHSKGPVGLDLVRLTRYKLAEQWRGNGGLDVENPDAHWKDSIKPDSASFKHWTLEASSDGKISGLRIYFEPYHVSGYVDGPQSVLLPASDIKAFVRPSYRILLE